MAQRVKTDWILFITIVMMVAFGLLMLYSASSVMAQMKYGSSSYFALRQLGWAAAALVAMMYLKRQDYRKLNTPAWAFSMIAIVIALLILVYVADPRAHRWLRLGSVSIQPSELAKPALILFLAFFVSRRARAINDRHTLMPAAMAVGLVAGMVMVADLGTALVLAATAAVVFYVAGLELRYAAVAASIVLVFVVYAIAAKPYRLVRVFGYVDPEYKMLEMVDRQGKLKAYLQRAGSARDPDYHVRQSLIAVGSGGVKGLGPMESKQKLLYLPEAHTDFIYAVIAEELGLWGALLVLAAYVLILWRGLRLYIRAPDDFGRYLALGVTTMLVAQAFFNISVVLGIVPPKGIPLPLISYGGSSLLSTLISLGILQSVGEQAG